MIFREQAEQQGELIDEVRQLDEPPNEEDFVRDVRVISHL